MKLNDVLITNWSAPGEAWWAAVKAKPDEPLIEATIKLTLSWNKYEKLLKDDRGSRVIGIHP